MVKRKEFEEAMKYKDDEYHIYKKINKDDTFFDSVALGIKIIELREKRHMSQKKLASLIGVSSESISKIELGKTSPQIETIARIAAVFEKNLEYFITGSEVNYFTDDIDYHLTKIKELFEYKDYENANMKIELLMLKKSESKEELLKLKAKVKELENKLQN